jgi:hypothetical protein
MGALGWGGTARCRLPQGGARQTVAACPTVGRTSSGAPVGGAGAAAPVAGASGDPELVEPPLVSRLPGWSLLRDGNRSPGRHGRSSLGGDCRRLAPHPTMGGAH